MTLVCAFYAIAWLPEQIFILVQGANQNLNFTNTVYYASVFLGFFYICANPATVAIRRCLDVVIVSCV